MNDVVPSPLSFVNCGNTLARPAVKGLPAASPDCDILKARTALKSPSVKSLLVIVSLSSAPNEDENS